ncbi:10784_t:CDS:2 [Rhizophagus irregularis]|nr:10784_t:CDS:2 [Rhizophagus irregularis]
MSYNSEKSPLIHFLVVLALLLVLALLITPVFWSFIAIIHIFVSILQLIAKFCTSSVGILSLIAKRALKAGSSCANTNGYRDVVRNINGVQIHLVLTIGVGFGAHRFYNLVEERPKFRLQLYIPDEPEIMPRKEQSGMRLSKYRPHVPSPLGPNYIVEWKELIDFYLSKRYASGISNGTRLSTTKEISELIVRSNKNTRGFSEKRVDIHNVKEFDSIEIPGVNPWINETRNKVVQQKRNNLSPQETLNAARAQLKLLLRSHKKRCNC